MFLFPQSQFSNPSLNVNCKQVLILPHIAFEGLDHEDACVKRENFIISEFPAALKGVLTSPVIDMDEVAKKINSANIDLARSGMAEDFIAAFKGAQGSYKFDRTNKNFLPRIYRGFSSVDALGKQVLTTNTGHLGAVDSVEHCNRVWGTAGGQIYKRRPTGN